MSQNDKGVSRSDDLVTSAYTAMTPSYKGVEKSYRAVTQSYKGVRKSHSLITLSYRRVAKSDKSEDIQCLFLKRERKKMVLSPKN